MTANPIAGTPATNRNMLRDTIDSALLHSGAPGSLEPTSGGVAPSRLLGDFLERGLQGLYEATGAGADVGSWLADALNAPSPDEAPSALARLLDAGAYEPGAEFEVPFMSVEEDRSDLAASLTAIRAFAAIPDRLPKEQP